MLSLYADSVESEEAGQMPTYGIEAIKQKNEQWNKMVSDVDAGTPATCGRTARP